MTLGERLQQLRKEKQMSQEELGNLLLVSRQTVSLWENNQTVPTVDNLIRLKEIFGVSIDSILTGEEPPATTAEADIQPPSAEPPSTDYYEPLMESYSYSLETNDLAALSNLFPQRYMKGTSVFLFLLFMSVVPSIIFADGIDSHPMIVIPLLFLAISLIKYIRSFIRIKKFKAELCGKNYTVELYRDYFIMKTSLNGDIISTRKVFLGEITACWDLPYCCVFSTNNNVLFPVKKSVFRENSYIGYLCNNIKTDKTDFNSKKIMLLKLAANVLIFCCFLSIFSALFLIAFRAESADFSAKNIVNTLSIFHWFLLIPILSIVTGILLRKNKIQNKKNIICGIIFGFIFLIYGFFPAIFSNVNNNLESLEAKLAIDFPEYIGMRQGTSTNLAGETERTTTLSFTESASNEFEAFILEDERWSNKGTGDFSAVYPPSKINIPYEVFLIYNVTTDEFGKLPDSEGKYEFIYIAYDTEMNTAYIFEYIADYHR